MPKKVHKYQIITDDLVRSIRGHKLQAGNKLPTERELAEKYGVARLTARRALGDLVEMGLAYRRGAGGTIVSDSENLGKRTESINILCSLENSSNTHQFLHFANAEAERRKLYPNIIRLSNEEEARFNQILSLPTKTIVFGEGIGVAVHNKLARSMAKNRNRCVIIGEDLSKMGVFSVTGDDKRGVMMAIAHLTSLGHEEIAIVFRKSSLNHPIFQSINQELAHFQESYAMDKPTFHKSIPVPEGAFSFFASSTYEEVKKFLSHKANCHTTAFFTLSPEMARGTAAAIRDHAPYQVENYTVLEFGSSPDSSLAGIPKPQIDVRIDKHVEKAYEILYDNPDFSQTSYGNEKHQFIIPRLILP